MTEEVQQKRPSHGVESLGDVDLDKHTRNPSGMQPFAGKSYCSEVVLDASSFDERALIVPHYGHEERLQATGKAFG